VATPLQLRESVADLTDLATADLDTLWRELQSPDEAKSGLLDVLPALVATYTLASVAVAADIYDGLRDDAGARGAFRAIPGSVDRLGAEELARWAVGPLYAAEPDWESSRVLVDGGLQRRIANGARETVTESAFADPGAQGWRRVGVGECAWCQQYLDGEIHYTEGYDFPAHDHCRCDAVPAF